MTTIAISDSRVCLTSPLTASNGNSKNVKEGPLTPRFGAWNRIVEEIIRLRSLPHDWDGQGAVGPDPANVDAAMAWVRRMRDQDNSIAPSWIVPGVTGEIVLEWRSDLFHLIAEIRRPDLVEWMLTQPNQPAQHWDTTGPGSWYVR